MQTIISIAFLVILWIVVKKVIEKITSSIADREFRRRQKDREERSRKELYKDVINTPLWTLPPKSHVLLDTDVLTMEWNIMGIWRYYLPDLAKALQLKIIILPEVYEELYYNGKKDTLDYLYKLRDELSNTNLQMDLPREHFGRSGRLADKKLVDYMLKNSGVYLLSFDKDLINRLKSCSSDVNMKNRVCDDRPRHYFYECTGDEMSYVAKEYLQKCRKTHL